MCSSSGRASATSITSSKRSRRAPSSPIRRCPARSAIRSRRCGGIGAEGRRQLLHPLRRPCAHGIHRLGEQGRVGLRVRRAEHPDGRLAQHVVEGDARPIDGDRAEEGTGCQRRAVAPARRLVQGGGDHRRSAQGRAAGGLVGERRGERVGAVSERVHRRGAELRLRRARHRVRVRDDQLGPDARRRVVAGRKPVDGGDRRPREGGRDRRDRAPRGPRRSPSPSRSPARRRRRPAARSRSRRRSPRKRRALSPPGRGESLPRPRRVRLHRRGRARWRSARRPPTLPPPSVPSGSVTGPPYRRSFRRSSANSTQLPSAGGFSSSKSKSPEWDSNPQPRDYKSVLYQLSYRPRRAGGRVTGAAAVTPMAYLDLTAVLSAPGGANPIPIVRIGGRRAGNRLAA